MRATVCPHDTARGLPLWIEFFVVLGAVSGRAFGFQPAADFPEFYRLWTQADLIYANPLDALRLVDEHGFLPVVQNDRYDEAVFLVREGVPKALEAFDGAEVGVVEGQFATLLAKRLLAERGIVPKRYRPYSSWGEVLDALRRGELTTGVLYRDFYEALSPFRARARRSYFARTNAGSRTSSCWRPPSRKSSKRCKQSSSSSPRTPWPSPCSRISASAASSPRATSIPSAPS